MTPCGRISGRNTEETTVNRWVVPLYFDAGARLPAVAPSTTTTTTSTTTSTSTSTTTTTSIVSCPGLVYPERAAVKFLAVERLDGRLCLLVVRHFDETKASGTSGLC